MDIQEKSGIFHLSGRMDEFSDFSQFVGRTSPLKLHLGKVTSINSVGVRKFLAFALGWSPKKFELYECTPEFIGNLNVIPQLIGNESDPTQIKSFYVPYACDPCKRIDTVLHERAKLTFDKKNEPVVLSHRCTKCGAEMQLDVDKDEYFTFLGQ